MYCLQSSGISEGQLQLTMIVISDAKLVRMIFFVQEHWWKHEHKTGDHDLVVHCITYLQTHHMTFEHLLHSCMNIFRRSGEQIH